MKLLISLLFVLLTGYAFGQEYTVIDVDGKAGKEIQTAIRTWTAETFKSAKDVVQLDESDRFIIKGTDMYEAMTGGYGAGVLYVFSYTIDFQIKDNRFRYLIKDETVDFGNQLLTVDQLRSNLEYSESQARSLKGAAKRGMEEGAKVGLSAVKQFEETVDQIKISIQEIPHKMKVDEEW